jgi:transposase InsO family protein
VSRERLIVTAVTVQGLSQAQAARTYGLSESRVSRIMARWRLEGEAALEPRSRRPKTSPTAIPASTVELIVNLRANLQQQGLDHGPETIAWHLRHRHDVTVSRSTVARTLTRAGLVTAEPTLADGAGVEILTFLDDCTRYAISVTAHPRVTTPLIVDTFRAAIKAHGAPATTLTDNGMVFTVRLAGWGRRGGRNGFETELQRLGIQQKNGSPAHPQTQGKVERFQQTMKKWLHARALPATLTELQTHLDAFVTHYTEQRPHRSPPHHATPGSRYRALPKAHPNRSPDDDPHDRVRRDRVDKNGTITLRVASRLRHIPLGRKHARTRILALIHNLDVTVINAATGELLRELTIDPDRDYQPLRNAKDRT